MKFLICVLSLVSLSVFAESKIGKPVEKTPNAAKVVPMVPGDKMASSKTVPLVPGDKKAVADCDKKVAEPVALKAESISLSNNSTGCSLDSAK